MRGKKGLELRARKGEDDWREGGEGKAQRSGLMKLHTRSSRSRDWAHFHRTSFSSLSLKTRAAVVFVCMHAWLTGYRWSFWKHTHTHTPPEEQCRENWHATRSLGDVFGGISSHLIWIWNFAHGKSESCGVNTVKTFRFSASLIWKSGISIKRKVDRNQSYSAALSNSCVAINQEVLDRFL